MKKLLSLFTALPLVAILMFSTFVFAGTGDIVVEGKPVVGKIEVGGGTLELPNSNTLPGTCAVGDTYVLTDALSGSQYYVCESTNIWTPQGSFYGAAYFPDYNEADQGATGDAKSAKAHIDIIAANNATLIFRHNSGAATTTYAFSTSETIPSNINIVIEKGAILSIAAAQTLTINGPFNAGLYPVFSGDVGAFIGGERIEKIYPQWFGAIAYDDTAGVTNYNAVRKALAFAISPKNEGVEKLECQTNIHFTSGKWFIEGNSPFCFTRTEIMLLPGASRYRRGLKISGNGRKSSILILENTGSHTWFYSTYDINFSDSSVMDNIEFTGLSFRNHEEYTPNRTYSVADALRTSGFYLDSSGWEKQCMFTNCDFSGLDECFHVEGSSNVDLNSFTNCHFSKIIENIFYFNNNQSVANKLVNCDFSNIYGHCFKIGPNGGGDILMVGGSVVLDTQMGTDGLPIIPNTNIRGFLYIDLEDELNTLGIGNGNFKFEKLRFEIYDDLQKLIYAKRNTGSVAGSATVTFEDCTFDNNYNRDATGAIIAPTANYRTAVTVKNNIRLNCKFKSCCLNERYTFNIEDYTTSLVGSIIGFRDCVCPWDPTTEIPNGGLIENCITSNTNGRGQFYSINTEYSSISTSDQKIRGAYDFDIRKDCPNGSLSLQAKYAHIKPADLTWPRVDGYGTLKLYLPPEAIVQEVAIYKPAVADPGGAVNLYYNLKLSGVTILYSTTNQLEYLEISESTLLPSPAIIPAHPNNYLELTPAGPSGADIQPTEGFYIIKYL